MANVSRLKNACRSLRCSPYVQVLLLREELEKARMVAAKAQILKSCEALLCPYEFV